MQNKSLHLLRNSIIRIKTTEQVISNLQEIKDENATRFLADMQVKEYSIMPIITVHSNLTISISSSRRVKPSSTTHQRLLACALI
jgi:hypothetical protein